MNADLVNVVPVQKINAIKWAILSSDIRARDIRFMQWLSVFEMYVLPTTRSDHPKYTLSEVSRPFVSLKNKIETRMTINFIK